MNLESFQFLIELIEFDRSQCQIHRTLAIWTLQQFFNGRLYIYQIRNLLWENHFPNFFRLAYGCRIPQKIRFSRHLVSWPFFLYVRNVRLINLLGVCRAHMLTFTILTIFGIGSTNLHFIMKFSFGFLIWSYPKWELHYKRSLKNSLIHILSEIAYQLH